MNALMNAETGKGGHHLSVKVVIKYPTSLAKQMNPLYARPGRKFSIPSKMEGLNPKNSHLTMKVVINFSPELAKQK